MSSLAAMDGPNRRYLTRTMAFMGGYVAVNVAAILGAFDEIIGEPAGAILGLAVAAPIAGQIWATLALMAESDEFVRTLTAKRFIVAAGLAMALFSGGVSWRAMATSRTRPVGLSMPFSGACMVSSHP
jgi:hypothetical protein